jgi:hypothetical protein
MRQTIENASQFRDEFRQRGRADQFSYEALGLLFDYLEEVDPDYDLDVIALCCEYSEESAADIARNYGIDLNDCDPEDGDYEEQCAAAVLAYLHDHTSVVGVTPSGIVYAQF